MAGFASTIVNGSGLGSRLEQDYGSSNSAQNISSNPTIGKYGTTSGGLAYLTNNADSIVNAVNQQALWDREDLKTQAAEAREDTALDRLVEAGKRNGINPIFLLDALSGNTGTAASYATSAAKTSNYAESERTSQSNSAKVFGALVAALAMVAASFI